MDTGEPAGLGNRPSDERTRMEHGPRRNARQPPAVRRQGDDHPRHPGPCFYTLYFASAIVLPFVLAIVLYLLLSPLMRVLSHRLRLPRTLSALVLILALFCLVGGIGAAISVPASGWIGRAPQSLPTLEKKPRLPAHADQTLPRAALKTTRQPDGRGPPRRRAACTVVGADDVEPGFGRRRDPARHRGCARKVFTVLLLLFFLLSSGDTLLRRLVEVLPPGKTRNARCRSPSRSNATSPAISPPSR